MTESGRQDFGHVDDLLPSMALGAATDQERAEASRHLAVCERCREELDVYRDVASRLPSELELPVPAPSLWERIERGIAAPATPAAPPSRVRQWPGWAAAAVIAIIAGAAGLIGGLAANNFGDDGPDLTGLEDIETADVVFTLATNDPSLHAFGRIFMSTDRTRGVVAVTGLEQLPDEELYAVWLVRSDDTRENVGTFDVDDEGASIAALSLPYLPGGWDESGDYVALSISRVSEHDLSRPVGGPIMVGPIY